MCARDHCLFTSDINKLNFYIHYLSTVHTLSWLAKKYHRPKKPASSHNKGSRKAKKAKNGEKVPPVGVATTRRKQTRKSTLEAAESMKQTSDEDDAAAALLEMAAPGQLPEQDSDLDEELRVDGDVDGEYTESTDHEFSGEDSETDSEIDEELDKAMNQAVPKIKLPAAKAKPLVFTLPFEVPYKNGTRDLTGLTSKSTFDQFLIAAATKMETRVTLLVNIGYVPSYKKPKPAPKLLNDEEAWDLLVADVGQHIKGAKSKNRGKGEVQPFSLLIVDMSEGPRGLVWQRERRGRRNRRQICN
ncbi:hypothetical protein B0H14DRAFT_2631131 [Mycena olivaceomarginata]|nr:hypothetical protein B0H14DRAFT_2631131 [Mycena olivaceomarginata]